MTALAVSVESVRDSRIYRVNAWRVFKGRPAIDFDAPKAVLRLEGGGSDWFTSRPPISADEMRRGVGKAISRAALIAPPTKAQYKAWEKDYLHALEARKP